MRQDPRRQRYPGFQGNLIVDTWRGRVRIRKWPRPTKKKPTARQIEWREAFKQSQLLAKFAPGNQQIIAMQMAKGTGMYPRDILTKAIFGGFYRSVTPFGTIAEPGSYRWEEVVYQGTITNTPASVLIPASTVTPLVWTLPVIDTMGMWSAGQPTRLTIPNHVDVVRPSAGVTLTGGSTTTMLLAIRMNGSTNIAGMQTQTPPSGHLTCFGQPIPVSPGDYFEATLFLLGSKTLGSFPNTYFCCDILETS